jgi:hypothetical protein
MSQSARGSLKNQEPQEHPLIFGDAGGRIRKDIGYVRNYMPEWRADLESGDLIMVSDYNSQIYFYIVDPRTKPMYMPERLIPVFTKWTTGIPVLANSAPAQSTHAITDMDMQNGEIGIWKIYAKTGGFMFTVNQPSESNQVFTDGTREIWMDYANTGKHAKRGEWGQVPEIVTFEKDAPVYLKVISENMNESTFFGYVAFEGYRYRLIKTDVPEPEDEPRVVKTIQLGSLK